jgi:hypothetical protein
LDALPKGFKYNQDCFIDNLFPALNQVRTGNGRHEVALTVIVHIDNSMCHNGAKTTAKMSSKGLGRAPRPAYSPDIISDDFWAFGTIKRRIQD